MIKLLCLMCGQVWYSASSGGNCDYCRGRLVEVSDDISHSPSMSNVVPLQYKRAVRKLTKHL